MEKTNGNTIRMKWYITVVITGGWFFSLVYRCFHGQGSDAALTAVIVSLVGVIWGGNLVNYFKK